MSGQVENVLFIVVDALRADRVGAYDGGSLTPHIDELASDGEVFENCYSCINATDPLLTTLLTGLYPTSHGVLNHADDVTEKEQEFVSSKESLPMRLSDTHTTIGIDILGRWHTRGFDQYLRPSRATRRSSVKGRAISGLSKVVSTFPKSVEQQIRDLYRGSNDGNASLPATADDITDIAVNAIESTEGPWFMLAHYWDTHLPYVSPDRHPEEIQSRTYDGGERPLSEILDPIRGSYWGERLDSGLLGDAETVGDMYRKYDAGVVHADRGVGQLLEVLKEEGEYEETAIVLLADHGESLIEHQILFDHHGLYEPTTHVPCIVKAPGFSGREDGFVQHFDFVPTVLDLLDEEYQESTYDGVTLVPEGGSRELNRDAVYMEEALATRKRGIRTDAYKYIESLTDGETCGYCDLAHADDRELYDLREDSEEIKNLIDERPDTAEDLSNRLDTWTSARSDPSRASVDFDTSEVMDHLEDLGYR